MNVRDLPAERWNIVDLKENPHQQELFGDLPDAQSEELAADMDVNGQRLPIEILPDGTIIDGHQRWHAAEKLGWAEVDVIVRHDLADAPEETIEHCMIAANLHRRQLDILAVARLYRRLKEMERGWDHDDFVCAGRPELRDRLAKRLGAKSGRTLDRYVKLLDAPREVQEAFSRHQLTMQDALRVLRLTAEEQAAIAEAIRADSGAAKAIVNRYLPGNSRSRRHAAPQHGPSPALAIAAVIETAAQSPATETDDDLGELQGPVDQLDAAVDEVIKADVATGRKIEVVVAATAMLETLLDESDAA